MTHAGLGRIDAIPGMSSQGLGVTHAGRGMSDNVLGVSCMGLSKTPAELSMTDDDRGMSGQGLGVTCEGLGDVHSADSRLASKKKIIVMPDCSPMLKLSMRKWAGGRPGQ